MEAQKEEELMTMRLTAQTVQKFSLGTGVVFSGLAGMIREMHP